MRERVERRTKRKLKKNGAIFLKGVIDFLIYKLTNLVVEKKTFVSLTDLKSAIEDDNKFNKLLKDVTIPANICCWDDENLFHQTPKKRLLRDFTISVKKKKTVLRLNSQQQEVQKSC